MITQILKFGIIRMVSDAINLETNQYIVDLILTFDLSEIDTLAQLDELAVIINKADSLTVVIECSNIYRSLLEGISVTISTTAPLN